jgi:hypothetical protein
VSLAIECPTDPFSNSNAVDGEIQHPLLKCQDILSWAGITIFRIPGLELKLKDGRRLSFSSEDAAVNLCRRQVGLSGPEPGMNTQYDADVGLGRRPSAKAKAKAASKQAALRELEEWMANAGRTETHLVERLGAAFDSMDCPQQEWVETLLAMPAAEVDELIASLEVHLHVKEVLVGGPSTQPASGTPGTPRTPRTPRSAAAAWLGARYGDATAAHVVDALRAAEYDEEVRAARAVIIDCLCIRWCVHRGTL